MVKWIPENSPVRESWKRLRRNIPAMFGLGWILLVSFIAIFGYAIAPDNTTDADNQMLRIKLENPGFSTKVLLVPNDVSANDNFLKILFRGRTPKHKYYPLDSYKVKGDTIVASLKGGDVLSLDKCDVLPKDKCQVQGEHIERQLVLENIRNKRFLLGTDTFGRDNLSRLILGTRISLAVGLIAVIISLVIGIFLGSLAGYFGGRADDAIMFLINTVWSVPTLLLVFAIVLAFGRGVGIIFIAVGLTMWVDVARIVRGQILSVKEMPYVEAAQAFGFGTFRILFRHILPNVLGPVMVIAAANFATAILLEAGLSYLGFGVMPPTPSWGTMLNENYGYAISGKPLLALSPALAVMSLVLAFNLLGNGLRDALDVKL